MLHLLRAFKPIAADFLSTIIFIAVYEITNNIVIATATGIAIGIVQIAWLRVRGEKIEVMQWASLALVVVLGSATLLTHDPRFVMIKPSIGAFAIGCVMLKRGWQSRYLPDIVKQNVSAWLLTAWGYIWSALYFALSAANIFIAYRLGIKDWAQFNAFVPTGAMLGLFLIQYIALRLAVRRNLRAKGIVSDGVIAPVAR